jgi:hypothetical protein
MMMMMMMMMMNNYPRARPHGCINTSIEKVFQNLIIATKFVNYNTSAIQTQLNKLWSQIEMSYATNVINVLL